MTQLTLFDENLNPYNSEPLPVQVSVKWQFPLQRYETNNGILYSVIDWIGGIGSVDSFKAQDTWNRISNNITTLKNVIFVEMLYNDIHGNDVQSVFLNDIGVYRVSQEMRVTKARPALEAIKEYLAEAGAYVDQQRIESVKKLSQKAQKRQSEIEKYNKAGLGDRPEIVLLKARHENAQGFDVLREIISMVCATPNYGKINNDEYKALFGMVAEDLRRILNTKSIRDSLPLRQIQALTLAEGVLSDMLSVQENVTMERIEYAIEIAIVPIGKYLKSVSDMQGLHHITGKPLLRANN